MGVLGPPPPGYVLALVLAVACASCDSDEVFDWDGDSFPNPEDCEPEDPAVNPNADEVCHDNLDNDCDGEEDEAGAVGCSVLYADEDGDGSGSSDRETCLCSPSDPFTALVGGDCDDGNPGVAPGFTEVCDGVDTDCDGELPADEADADGDGWSICQGDCDDGEATTNPGAAEVCNDGIDNDCDQTAIGCLFAGEISLSDADVRLADAVGDDWAGCAVAGAGDLDQDGYADILIGAKGDDGGGEDAGAVHLFRGPVPADASLANPDTKLVGVGPFQWAGTSVSPAGDMDGDGVGEFLVGAPSADGEQPWSGVVYVWSGAAAGTFGLDSARATLRGEREGDKAGSAVAWAGDLDGDGQSDILVGASMADTGVAEAGIVYMFSGPLVGPIDLVLAPVKIMGNGTYDQVGAVVSSAGDANGDGHEDVMLSTAFVGNGMTYLLPGPLEGEIWLPADALEFEGEYDNDLAGASLALAGDVDGDDHDDLLIGAAAEDCAAENSGAAYLLAGPLDDSAALATAGVELCGESLGAGYAGTRVAGIGDVNLDGLDDILVGAVGDDAGGTDAGAVYLLHGPVTQDGSLADADAKFIGEAAGDTVGYALSPAGDVNGDGRADFLIGAPGIATFGYNTGGAYLVHGKGM
jgi:hypothetical protein